MKIVDWFKNLLSRTRKKDYMLNGINTTSSEKKGKVDFVQKVDVNDVQHTASREDILKSLLDDIMVTDLSEEYNYGKFSNENIKTKYDKDSILSDEDMTALSCLYGAIKDGNKKEYISPYEKINNKINAFLKENINNIVILINLMIKNAKELYDSLGDKRLESTTVQGLIPGSYGDISEIIEKYKKEIQQARE